MKFRIAMICLGAALICGGSAARLAAQPMPFIRGDVNGDGATDISDAVSTLGCLFGGEACAPCADAADTNDDGAVDISDAVATLGFLFLGDPPPPPPFPVPGFDATPNDPNTCGDAPPGVEPGSIAISEIHYHPLSGNPEDEFIELYNRTGLRLRLDGLRFTKGVDYTFGPNVSLDPGAYLVVARNADRIRQRYGIANVIGNWTGQLDDGGETIRIKDGRDITVIEVQYDDGGGLWPRWADGYGSSLELIDLQGDIDSHQAWEASDETQKSQWRPFEIRQTAAGGSNELHILLLSQGECLIDNLQVLVNNQNLLSNGGFESGIAGWLAQGTHRSSAVTNEDSIEGSRSLHLVATGRGDTASNRIERDLNGTVSSGQLVIIRGSVRWLRGARYLLARLHGNAAAQSLELAVPDLGGTPGRPNSTARLNRGPDIRSVVHSPILPNALQNVAVTALASDVDGVASVQLNYRIDGTATDTALAMTDDGQSGDLVAGDGVYSAVIPRQSTGRMMAFWVRAADGRGAEARFPAAAPARTCLYRVGEPSPNSRFNRYHIWMPQATIGQLGSAPKMSNEMFDITFVLDGAEVFYNAEIRYRGSPFIRRQPPTDPVGGRFAYRIDFGEHQPMNGRNEINLDNLEPGRDPTIQRERAAYILHQELGLPFSEMNYVRLWINGNDHGVYADVQKIDNDYVKVHWPEDAGGNLHKVDDYFEFDDSFNFSNRDARLTNYGNRKEEYRWNYEKRDDDRNDDFTPVMDLTRLMNATGAAYEASVESIIDPEQWARALAVRRIIGDWDSFGYRRGKNNYLYRPPLDGRWVIVPWDMDFLLGNGDGPSSSLFGGLDPAVDRFLDYPKYKRMYLRAFRELVDGPFQNRFLDPILDNFYNVLRSETSVSDPGSIKSWITQRRNYVLSQLPAGEVIILTNNGEDFSTSATSITIEGDAPLEVESWRLNGAAFTPTITGISKWSFTRPLAMGWNTFKVDGFGAGSVLIGSDTIRVLRVEPCAPASVQPSAVLRTVVTLTIRGSGFVPGSPPQVRLASASTEPGFNASYAQSGGSFGDINNAEAFLNNPTSAVRTLSTSHLTISLRTEGGGEIFPTVPFPSPWNSGSVSNLAARYSGFIHASSAGVRTLGVHSDDGFRLRINGVLVAEYPPPRGPGTTLGTYNFPAAGAYPIQLDWYENGGGDIVQFFQETTGGVRRLVNQASELTVTRDNPRIVNGSGVQVIDASTISASFNFTGAETGLWSLEITPVLGSVCRLQNAVTVQ